MSKLGKRILITGSTIILIGIMLIGLGWVKNGFNFNVDWQNVDGVHFENAKASKVSPFNTVKIDADSQVTIKSGDQFKIITQDTNYGKVFAKVQNHQLVITNQRIKKTNLIDKLRINGSVLKHERITVIVPKKTQLKAIQQNKFSHGMNLDQLHINNDLKLSGSDITLKHVTAKRLVANADVGDVNVYNSQFEVGSSRLSTATGDVVVHGSKFKELTKAHSNTGDVSFNDNVVQIGTTQLSNSTGDVNVHRNHFTALKIKDATGDISFSGLQIKHNLTAKNDIGDIEGALLKNDRADIDASTSIGDTSVNKQHLDVNSHKHYVFKNNVGDITIH